MPQLTNPVDILLTHNHWANISVLKSAQTLSPQQYHKRFEIGPGSVHDTLSHILGAIQRWTRALNGQELHTGLKFEATQRTADELLALAHTLDADLTTAAKAHPAQGTVTASRNGQTYTFIRATIITHITTHGIHHRAQCLNMFRQLGITPTPPTSVIEWSLTPETN